MSHLAEVYAKDLGVKIGQPVLNPHFFPIIEDKYITIHNDKKIQAKEYDFWPYVVRLLKKYLPEYKILQIGASNESKIVNVDKHVPTQSLKQCAYIIKNACCHVGIDSAPIHIASALDVPVVGIYAHTYAKTCDPLWNKQSKSFTIESHRDGKKPSFSIQENDKQINKIRPEQIVEKVCEALNIEKRINFKTLYIGKKCVSEIFQIIPLEPINQIIENSIIRMDIAHNESILQQILSLCSAQVVTSKPINEKLLATKKIKTILYKSDEFDEDFINLIRKYAINLIMHCTDDSKLSQQRVKFFDFMIDECKDTAIIEKSKKNAESFIDQSFKFNCAKKVIVGNKLYNSLYDFNDQKNIDDFYIDLEYNFVYSDVDE